MWILNKLQLNKYWVKKEIKEETKRQIKTNENTACQNLGDAAQAVLKREVCSNTGLPQETTKTSNKNIALRAKKLENEEQVKPKVSLKKGNNKNQNGNK